MKAAQLRDMSEQALGEKLLELRKEQLNQRLQRASGQLGQTHLLNETRREIARVKTVLQEKGRHV